MPSRKSAFAAVLVLLMLALPAGATDRPVGGDVPPDFVGLDAEGNRVLVSAFRGKVVALVFWASWCGQCRSELPLLEKLQQGVGRDHLEVIAVNYKESLRDYRRLRRNLKYTMTMTHDPEGEVGATYGVRGVPHLVLVDRSGTIAYVNIGFDSETSPVELTEQFNELLNEKPPG